MMNTIKRVFLIDHYSKLTIKHIERVGIYMNSPKLKTYTIQEVSKLLNIPVGTIKRFEKDLDGLLIVPRTKQGARYFTELEITFIKKIKELRDANTSIEKIKETFLSQAEGKADSLEEENGTMETTEVEKLNREEFETSIVTVSPSNDLHAQTNEPNIEDFFKVMDIYKQNLLDEVKSEIRNGIRKEVIDEVKKEISKGQLQTVKTLSSSLYKLSENTKSDLQELSNMINESSENTTENIVTLSHIITATSEHTSGTIENLSNRVAANSENTLESLNAISQRIAATSGNTTASIKTLSEEIENVSINTTEKIDSLSRSISMAADITHHELSNLVDSINKDRELYIQTLHQERLHFNQEIRSREAMFQDLVSSFRNTAASKDPKDNKKWWMFWK